MKRRSGTTLVEALGVVSATLALLTLAALLLGKTFDAHRDSLLHLQRMRSLDLFVERLREDVQSCSKLTTGPELVIAKSDNSEIVYSIVNQSIVRTRRQEGQDIGLDHWQLPAKCKATWNVNDSGRISLLEGQLQFEDETVKFETITLVSRMNIGGRL